MVLQKKFLKNEALGKLSQGDFLLGCLVIYNFLLL